MAMDLFLIEILLVIVFGWLIWENHEHRTIATRTASDVKRLASDVQWLTAALKVLQQELRNERAEAERRAEEVQFALTTMAASRLIPADQRKDFPAVAAAPGPSFRDAMEETARQTIDSLTR